MPNKKLVDTSKAPWVEVDACEQTFASPYLDLEAGDDLELYWNQAEQILVKRYFDGQSERERFYTETVYFISPSAQISLRPQKVTN